ncbi:MAG: 30S ribosomal protein S20 [Candidatus Omnitrophota bacterium]
MPKRKAALKSLRADKKKHARNQKVKKELKKTLKKFQLLISAKNISEAKSFLVKVFSVLDKAAKKKVIHPNLASRKKSRLAKSLSKSA